ncbi:MAG: SusC/RagA family TonB-linked outer membrane protein, partial [Tannerellaceae bacterium]
VPTVAMASPETNHETEPFTISTGVTQQSKTIKGTVVDETGEPLIGVSIAVKGTTNGTVTDMDGNFTLPRVSGKDVITLTYVGYHPINQTIGNQTVFKFTMKEDTKTLDEVVVVGFGSQKKVNVTGAVSQVSAEALEARPVQNVSQALQGVVPGLNFSTNNRGGELNNTLNVNIRGGGTIGDGSNSSPLILIDGVEGSMNALNPQDIESISVLKDAASAAVYGSRAPFGVILITTKSGKSGRTTVNYNNSLRFSDPISMPRMMDSYSFAQYFNQAATNSGQNPVFNDEMLDRIIKYQKGELLAGATLNENNNQWNQYGGANANTDWFQLHYKDWVFSQEHNVSVNGGNEKVTYLVSGNIMDSNGLLQFSNDNFKRYSLNSKLNVNISDQVKMTYGSRWIREEYDRASYQTPLFYHNIARRWPTNPLYDPNGYYMEHSEAIQLSEGGRDKSEKDWMYQQLQLTWEPIKNWKIVGEGNIRTITEYNHWEVLPVYAHDGDGKAFPMKWSDDYSTPGMSRVSEGSSKTNFYTTNLYTDYFKEFGDGHFLKAMVGFNAELEKGRSLSARRDGLISASVPTVNTGTSNDRASGGYSHWSTAGFFGRINYNYKERYMVELNGRYDGTSRFVGDKRWNFFPSFSLGWNIAREEFWQPYEDIVNTFKLRGSWGELGNQNTKALYPFFQTMPFGTANGGWLINGKQPNTSYAPGLVSSLLTWERVRSWNIGLDWGAFNNRLTGSFDYFVRKTLDMIGPAPELPEILGTSVPKLNNADMESYGFELEVSWRDRIGNVSYGVKGVLSDAQQKVTRYPNKTGNNGQWYAGRLNGEIWGYETIGIAKTQEEMDAHLATLPNGGQNGLGNKWSAGDIMYKDLNGDGKIDGGAGTLSEPGDRRIIGNTTPRYSFGLTLDAQWKGFDISVFLQGVGKRDYALGGPYFWGVNGGQWQSAGFKEHWDFYRPDGDPLGANLDSYYPRPLFDGSGKNQQTQTKYLQNAAYIRLKNLQLGYTFPQQWISKAGIQYLRVFVSGDNLLTGTKLTKIFDPEVLGGDWGEGKAYPLSRVISFGLNVNF